MSLRLTLHMPGPICGCLMRDLGWYVTNRFDGHYIVVLCRLCNAEEMHKVGDVTAVFDVGTRKFLPAPKGPPKETATLLEFKPKK